MVRDTKSSLIEVAAELFASQGYHGTSIREIALKAQVNLAAVNYHFQNKATLFQAVFQYNYDWMDKSISQIAQNTDLDSKQFTWQIYEFFCQNETRLMSVFRTLLTNDSELNQKNDPHGFGPPGEQKMLYFITKEVGEKVSLSARHWAVRMIFSHIVHAAVVKGSSLIRNNCKLSDLFNPEFEKIAISALVEAVINYLIGGIHQLDGLPNSSS